MSGTAENRSDSGANVLKTVGAVLGGVLSLVAILGLIFNARINTGIENKFKELLPPMVETKVGETFHGFMAGEGKEFRSFANTVAERFADVVPIGTVVAFAGESTPHGWLLCDGRELKKDEYETLFERIGTTYGDGGGKDGYFSLPDYRGIFLRGVSGDAPIELDPDRDGRDAPYEKGTGGNAVGSRQGDATGVPNKPFWVDTVADHTHAAGSFEHVLMVDGAGTAGSLDPTLGEPNVGSSKAMMSAGGHSHQMKGGDSETRPGNVYVNWIIKCSHLEAEKAGESS
jgi:hypothetical protein